MKNKKLIYLVIIIGFALLILNISELDFENIKKGPFAGIISDIFLILAMIVTLRDLNKNEKETN